MNPALFASPASTPILYHPYNLSFILIWLISANTAVEWTEEGIRTGFNASPGTYSARDLNLSFSPGKWE